MKIRTFAHAYIKLLSSKRTHTHTPIIYIYLYIKKEVFIRRTLTKKAIFYLFKCCLRKFFKIPCWCVYCSENMAIDRLTTTDNCLTSNSSHLFALFFSTNVVLYTWYYWNIYIYIYIYKCERFFDYIHTQKIREQNE